MRSSIDGKNDLSLQIYVISPSSFYEACIILQISVQLSNLLMGVVKEKYFGIMLSVIRKFDTKLKLPLTLDSHRKVNTQLHNKEITLTSWP